MKRLDLIPAKLARLADVSKTTLSDWSDWKRIPKMAILARVADVLHVDLEDFYTGKGQPAAMDGLIRVDGERAALLKRFDEDPDFRRAVRNLLKAEWKQAG